VAEYLISIREALGSIPVAQIKLIIVKTVKIKNPERGGWMKVLWLEVEIG
jgi:hypothetical protein